MISFEVEYRERRVRVELLHFIPPFWKDHQDLLGCLDGCYIRIRKEDRRGSPRFHGTLAHEAYHLAGRIAKDSGFSLDPQNEDVPELAALIVEGVLEGIEDDDPETDEPF